VENYNGDGIYWSAAAIFHQINRIKELTEMKRAISLTMRTSAVLAAYVVTAIALPAADTFSKLFNFNGHNGSLPESLIQATDGLFYGSTYYGGKVKTCIFSNKGCGSIFKMTPDGKVTSLYSFGSGADGGGPLGALLQARDGDFYGTTRYGGTHNWGTVFRVTPKGSVTTLYSFSGSDGGNPETGLVEGFDGDLYGTTYAGGDLTICTQLGPGCGAIFKITRDGTLTTLHIFKGNEGANPQGSLVQDMDGNFYGTTSFGGDRRPARLILGAAAPYTESAPQANSPSCTASI
jgi:uncharacterized repeat protein (TIGR03803 family)